MYQTINARLSKLEHRPQSQFPRFILEYEDGHRENFVGADVISHYMGVKRVFFDETHQPSVDAATLFALLHDGIEVLPTI